jgi:uncharacterized membrane protein
MYRCGVCRKEIEKAEHCGRKAELIRGHVLFTNDTVNMISSLFGAAVCVIASAAM